MMRVVLVGSKTVACDVAFELCDHLALIVGEPDHPWQESLEEDAKGLRVPYTTEWADALCMENIDYVVSAQAARIFKPGDLMLAKHGFINIHFGKLPEYRGCNPIYHAMMAGDPHAYCTYHFIDEGIDTGDIIGARGIQVGGKTAREVFDALTLEAHSMCRSLLPAMQRFELPRRPQATDGAHYYKKADVDFGAETARFKRMAKALAFPPFQDPMGDVLA